MIRRQRFVRWRPEVATGNDHKQHKNVPNMMWAASTEEHMSLFGHSGVQARLQFVSEELGLGFDVLGQVFLGGTGTMRTR